MKEKERRKKLRGKKPRIVLTPRDLDQLYQIFGTKDVVDLAKQTGFPYLFIYNIVNRRVLSVSHRNYQTLFRREPPTQNALKVDGAQFRAMAELWLYLNDGQTQADLYKELFKGEPNQNVDHRIFNGKINSVEMRIEHQMLRKFVDEGVSKHLLQQWLDEFEALSHENWVPYSSVRPMLVYLEEKLGLHPTSVLKQSIVRYETGELKRVLRSVADRAESLKRKTEKALQEDGQKSIDKIREVIIGGKDGYTLYSDIKEELHFLGNFSQKSIKHYLGRGRWMYENGRAKRIADWRARIILQDCDDLIRQTPTLILSSLPPSRQQRQIRNLLEVLVARNAQLLSNKEGLDFEKRILRPSHRLDEYKDPHHGFTPFDMAPQGLGMNRKAFDLMVARHCDIFRTIGKFSERWYLPELYLREISSRKEFDLISAKYELLAKDPKLSQQPNTCMV